MGYLAFTVHRTTTRRWGKVRTQGGRGWASVGFALLLVLGGAGVETARGQTGSLPEPPAAPYGESLPPPTEYYPAAGHIQTTPPITPNLPAGTKSVPVPAGAKFAPVHTGFQPPVPQPGELPRPKVVPPFQKGHIPLACPPGTLGTRAAFQSGNAVETGQVHPRPG
jgi:hypothetical protein